MPDPWTKKNPAMSLFLSDANAWAGKGRELWTKEARSQHGDAVSAGAKQVASFWTAALTPPASGGKTRKPRR